MPSESQSGLSESSNKAKAFDPLLNRLRRWYARVWHIPRIHRTYRSKNLAETFGEVYRTKAWGDNGTPFFSGGGSHGPVVEKYCAFVVQFIGDRQVQSVVDIGCGDFTVGRQILEAADVRYTGVDVVPELIQHHQNTVHDPRVGFLCADATRDPLPSADLCLIRQVFQHLSNDEISRALANLTNFLWILVSEEVPFEPTSYNLDKPHGPDVRGFQGSGVFLDQPPFSMAVTEVWRFTFTPHSGLRTVLLEHRALGLSSS
jgi:SAM-dependent methyltransferase